MTTTEVTQMLPLEKVHESPFHRRTTWGDLEELAESIRQVGILENVLVRPHPKKPGHYELVFGHRRRRAGKIANLTEISAKVRDLTDEQVVELQIVENLQREDVHPLDEAEGYGDLLRLGKYSHDELAARVGKSRSYVFGRLKLLNLCDAARKALSEGKLNTSTALYVARLPSPKLQQEALKELTPYWRTEPLSAREAFRIIEGRFMLRLVEAPFDQADATLVPDAGACGACPKKTGNQPELFADVSSADVCTDPNCFALKKSAHGERRLKEAAKQGQPILKGKQAQAATQYGSKLVKLDARCYEDPKQRTHREMLKGADVPVTLAKVPGGDVVELVPRTAVAKVLPTKKPTTQRSATNTVERGIKDKYAQDALKERAVIAAVVAAAEKREGMVGLWKFIAGLLMYSADVFDVLDRRGIEVAKKKNGSHDSDGDTLRVALKAMTDAQARGLAIELALPGYTDALKDAAAFYKVDVAKVGAAAIAAAKKLEQAKASAAPKAKAATKKPAAPAKKSAAKKSGRA